MQQNLAFSNTQIVAVSSSANMQCRETYHWQRSAPLDNGTYDADLMGPDMLAHNRNTIYAARCDDRRYGANYQAVYDTYKKTTATECTEMNTLITTI